MKKRIFTILGWALIALAVGGLFILAADLPANGYELRFEEPLSVLQADSLSKAAEYLGLSLALWKEDSETVTTDLERSSAAQCISVYGSPTLCFPAACLYGSAPGAGQWDGCAVSAGLADALFGSREVTGLELMVKGEKRRVTGVVEGKECFLICPDVTASDAGYTAASLEIENGNNPRGTIQNLLQSAGLSENDAELLPTGTLRQIINAVAWIPLTIAALLFLHQLWRLAPFGKMGRQVAACSTGTAGSLGRFASLAGSQPMVGYEFLDGLGQSCQAKPDGIWILDKFGSGSTARHPNTCVRRLPAGAVGRGAAAGTEKLH